jgi:hypothetical protein
MTISPQQTKIREANARQDESREGRARCPQRAAHVKDASKASTAIERTVRFPTSLASWSAATPRRFDFDARSSHIAKIKSQRAPNLIHFTS